MDTSNIDYSQWNQKSGNTVESDPTKRLHNRLRAILELTRSTNEAEASKAAAKLQEMLTEHNLSVADLEAKGQKSPGMREQPHDLGKAAFKWKLDLAEGIAEFYYCAPLVDRKTKSVSFVGRPDNVDALMMLYAWVIDQIKDIAREERRVHHASTGQHIDPLRWQISFGEGAVERLIERMRDLKLKHEGEASRNDMGDVTALVVHRQAEVSDYLEEKFGYRLDGKKTKAELASEERWAKYVAEVQAARNKKEEARAAAIEDGDMEPFYEAYPEEHPDEIARKQKEDDAYMKKHKHRRYRGRSLSTRVRRTDDVKEDQSYTAREAGKKAASKVNLQPFLTGNTDKKKVRG